MKQNSYFLFPSFILAFLLFSCQPEKPKTAEQVLNSPLFQYQDLESRWNSFENPTSGKGIGAMENKNVKVRPYVVIKAV